MESSHFEKCLQWKIEKKKQQKNSAALFSSKLSSIQKKTPASVLFRNIASLVKKGHFSNHFLVILRIFVGHLLYRTLKQRITTVSINFI